ncbi:hypothetical protein DLE60_11130 [Micromonospora globispora]|uniref:D-alanyl-D-alanine carboxypeptidase n=1 Tax=Micromonospora globispora TaxID=1450148 RepID=A0A317K6Q6_9ACTN|nr:hypothetical protein [Micromonospora globispora]PWU47512.1 hypothetical protein DLJ46_14430 [Micromonospora globispora]PWU60429.1 hypothetical protein DLE60_11130 [Micromonospora globispora]RQW95993.1 hypothetical protein DKL51_14025 [Micromonospora globispora]
MSVTFSDQDKLTLRTAAYGSVALLSAAGAAGGSPHKIATDGSIALASATGLVGHVLAEKSTGVDLDGKSVAELADRVLPALTEAMRLLQKQAPAEAGNFRRTVVVALEAAVRTQRGEPSPTVAEMTNKIIGALDAAAATPEVTA